MLTSLKTAVCSCWDLKRICNLRGKNNAGFAKKKNNTNILKRDFRSVLFLSNG